MQYSVVRYSEVKENSDFRIDAEYFKKSCLEIHAKIKNKGGTQFFRKIKKISSGKNLEQNEGGRYKFIRTQNVRPILIDDSGMSQVNEYRNLKPTKEGELIFVRVGEGVGNSSIITKNYSGNTISDNVLRLEIKDINPYFCSVFFNSEIGQAYFKRVFKGTARSLISQENFKDVLVPVFTDSFQFQFQKLINQSQELQNQSKSLYNEAEDLLLEELGLKDWKSKHQLSYIKKYSDTQEAERFDAEYFQPQYEKVEDSLKSYSLGHSFVKDEFRYVKDVFKTNPEKIYQYVEIGSVNVSNSEITPENVLGSELPANAKRKLSKNQVIISKVRTYRGAISIVDNENYVGSGAFTVLEEKTDSKLNKETLLVLLKSKPLLAWSLKPNTGTSYPVIIDNDILNLPLPLIPKNIQTQIKSNIEKSNIMRGQSKSLLEIAKKAVEIAIETSEDQASKWIDQELEKLGVELRKE